MPLNEAAEARKECTRAHAKTKEDRQTLQTNFEGDLGVGVTQVFTAEEFLSCRYAGECGRESHTCRDTFDRKEGRTSGVCSRECPVERKRGTRDHSDSLRTNRYCTVAATGTGCAGARWTATRSLGWPWRAGAVTRARGTFPRGMAHEAGVHVVDAGATKMLQADVGTIGKLVKARAMPVRLSK